MRILRPSVLIFGLIFGLLCPHTSGESTPLEDLEASGDDHEMSGSGEEPKIAIPTKKATDMSYTKEEDEPSRKSQAQPWNKDEIVVSESKSILESKDFLAVVIAGGVTGFVLAVLLAGVLIYKWHHKDEAGYIQGQTRDQEFHRNIHKSSNCEEAVLV